MMVKQMVVAADDVEAAKGRDRDMEARQHRGNGIFWLLLSVIIVLAAFLRLYKLDSYPLLFNQDSSVLGYDAWSIWLTGHDHHGKLLPVFFQTFNDYVTPVPNYIVAPFVGILGLNEFTTRLPIALAGILTIFFVALLGRRWFNGAVGILAALLLTIDPWHLNYSRIAFPNGFVPLFTVVALYCLTRGMELLHGKESGKQVRVFLWLAGSGIAFGLLTGTYPATKLQAPLLLAACLVALLPWLWSNHTRTVLLSLGWWLATYVVCILPLVIVQLKDWKNIQGRYNSMSVTSQPHWLLQFFEQYSHHFNPSNFFFDGFPGGVSVHPPFVGELFWLEGPLWIIAAIGLWQGRHVVRKVGFSIGILVLLWFVTFPVASSLTTMDIPHEIRSYNFLPLPELLAGYGAMIVWEELSCLKFSRLIVTGVKATTVGIVTCIFVYFVSLFLSGYFAPLPTNVDQYPYNIGLASIYTQVMPKVQKCDVVWVDDANQPYIYYLFDTHFDPQTFQALSGQAEVNYNGFRTIGPVRFGNPDLTQVRASPGCSTNPGHVYWITRTKQVDGAWHQIARSQAENGVTLWRGFEFVGK